MSTSVHPSATRASSCEGATIKAVPGPGPAIGMSALRAARRRAAGRHEVTDTAEERAQLAYAIAGAQGPPR